MRFSGRKTEDDWEQYRFLTTYPNSWESILAMSKVVADYSRNAAIRTCPIAGAEPSDEAYPPEDVWKIPEAGVLIIDGESRVFDDVPIRVVMYNQLDVVDLYVPSQYLSSQKNSDGEPYSDADANCFFDKYMDSVEINGAVVRAGRRAEREALRKMEEAFRLYAEELKNGSEGRYVLRSAGYELDLSEIARLFAE